MSTATVAAPATRRAPTHVLRATLLALAVVVLLVLSFVVGRATADPSPAHAPTVVPATAAPGVSDNRDICRVGKPC